MRKSTRRTVESRFMSFVSKVESGCWEWVGASHHGYGYFRMNNKIMGAHRSSYLLNIGEIPNNLCVCHSCDNPKCVNPAHLWLGTHLDNSIDKIKKGRGIFPGRSTLSKEQRILIVEMYKTKKYTQKEIAKIFNVTQGNIGYHVRKG